jgi:hypothetical protein
MAIEVIEKIKGRTRTSGNQNSDSIPYLVTGTTDEIQVDLALLA